MGANQFMQLICLLGGFVQTRQATDNASGSASLQ